MAFDRPLFLLLLAVPPLVWWLLRPPGRGRAFLTYRLELWLRAARELGLLEPRATSLRIVPPILAAVALALAGAGPRLGGVEGPDRLLVLLDRSPSMGARDGRGRTRLDAALERLAAELSGLPPEVEVRAILAGGERLGVVAGRVGERAEWWPRLAAQAEVAGGRAGLTELLAGLEALGEPVLVLSDLAGPERPAAGPAGRAHLRRVGERVDNGALLDLLLAPTWPAPEVQATALVRPGGSEQSLVVRAPASGELLASVSVPASPVDLLEVPLSWPRRCGAVQVRLEPADAFAWDDALDLAPLPPPALRVAIRTGPGEAPSALARSTAFALATGEGRVVGVEDDPDLVVVEGGRLQAWPDRARPDWLLLGTAVAGMTGENLLEAPEPGAWESSHPLLRGLDLSQLGVDWALRVVSGGERGRALFRAANGEPLLLAAEGEPRIVHLLFLPGRSSLGAELLWPRFLHRSLGWFARAGEERVEAARPGGAPPDLEESDLGPGDAPQERPLPAFAASGAALGGWLMLFALLLLALWLLLLAPRPESARLPFSAGRG